MTRPEGTKEQLEERRKQAMNMLEQSSDSPGEYWSDRYTPPTKPFVPARSLRLSGHPRSAW
jgi:hypothetical protein